MENATLDGEVMRKKQVAAFYQCCERQVENLVKAGRVPKPFYLGENSPRWRRSELLKHLDGLAAEGGER